jgi:hypothetical protein
MSTFYSDQQMPEVADRDDPALILDVAHNMIKPEVRLSLDSPHAHLCIIVTPDGAREAAAALLRAAGEAERGF